MVKRLKKLLSYVLAVSMAMSAACVNALAEESPVTCCGKEEHTHSIEAGCYEELCGEETGEGAVAGHVCEHVHDGDCGYVEAVAGHDCNHAHNEECGFVETVAGHTCGHEHDETCGYVEAQDEVSCDKDCTDTNDDGVIDHVEDCAYRPAVEGHACGHTEHDETCGYVEAVAGKPCNHVHDGDCGYVEAVAGHDCNHAHNEECGFVEAVEGHTHTEACYAAELSCGKEEHAHSEECYYSIVWNEETATLTIRGKVDVTSAMVQQYKGKVKIVDVDIDGTIGDGTFGYCGQLEEATVKNASTIGKAAFRYSNNLKKLSLSNIGVVGESVAHGCKNLAELNLENIGTIGVEAFQWCEGLTSIDLNTVGKLERSAFTFCNGLTEVVLTNIELGTNPFYQCANLSTVTLDNVTFSGTNTFDGCTSLKTAVLKNMDSAGNNMFVNCANLEEITLENVTNIGASLFSGKANLKRVTLTGENVTIGQSAFLKCTALSDVKLNGVTTIGPYAFQYCTSLESIELDGVTTIDQYAFSRTGLKQAALTDIGTIGQYSFWDNASLETVTMAGIDTIDQYAFWGCKTLETIDSLSNVTGRIGGFAFYGCESLTGLTVEDMTKMGYNGSVEMMERMQAILAGKFQLDNAEQIAALTRDSGWTVGAIDQSDNWQSYDNGTQLMEQARWQNADSAVAEVKVDAYYTAQRQMDYIFVADLSASMAQLGNPEDNNARFYDMQSKLLDMTGKLLGTSGYDCQVAIVTFGGFHANHATADVMEFSNSADNVAAYIKELEPLNENTDYKLGLNKVLEVLAGQQTDRNTVVVFLSDGGPTRDGETQLTSQNIRAYQTAIAGIANQITGKGVPIYGVLHSPTASGRTAAMQAMNAVCGVGNVYESTDTESFGEAMNAAFAAAYGNNTVTVPVNADDFDVSSLSATAGEVSYSNGIITWTLNGMPFTQHTLTYNMTLKDELADRIGTYSYSINNGQEATFGESGASVGLDLTLDRTVNPDAPVIPSVTYYTLTVNYVDVDGVAVADSVTLTQVAGSSYSVTSPVIEGYTADQEVVSGTMTGDLTVSVIYTADEADIDDENPPLAELPDTGEENPDADLPKDPTEELPDEEDISDEDVPLTDVPKTGDHTNRFLVMAAVSGLCLLTLLSGRRKEEEL